jgi:hypothetical protein
MVGIAFLGTPHRGTHSAQLEAILSHAAILFGQSWKERIIEELKYESRESQTLDEQFAWVSPSKETSRSGLVRLHSDSLSYSSQCLSRVFRSLHQRQRQFTEVTYGIYPWLLVTLR